MPPLALNNVTLCAADCANTALTGVAMRRSMARCSFGDAVIYTHKPFLLTGVRTVPIPQFDGPGYQAFRLKPPPIKTPFALWIEWDGYVTDERAWKPEFLDYDYIGAKWLFDAPGNVSGFRVGNSGFCLQSKKMMDALRDDPRFVPVAGQFVDLLMCGPYRPILESDYGIRFAPPEVADLFSYEATLPSFPTFGFHGFGNIWRHANDDEIIKMADTIDPYVFLSRHYTRLIASYALQAKYSMVEALYARMKKHFEPELRLAAFRRTVKEPHGDAMFELAERLVSHA